MATHQDLVDNIIFFDHAVREFAEKHPSEFNIHLEFPTVARQQKENEQLDGYLKETMYYTALAIDCIAKLKTSQVNEATAQLKTLIIPKLTRNISQFISIANLDKSFFDPNTHIICLDLFGALKDITKD